MPPVARCFPVNVKGAGENARGVEFRDRSKQVEFLQAAEGLKGPPTAQSESACEEIGQGAS